MTAPYAEEALWMKARLFMSRAMDSDPPRSFDEQALWASLSLELLAKAALARVSPLLIATPNEEGTNLLIASGLVEGQASFHSVPAKTVFTRCARAFHPFSLKEATTIAVGRNEYLHGGAATLTPLPAEAWWPRFWAQAIILLTAQDKEIEDLVGSDRVSVVEDHLERNREHIQERLTALIERAKQRLTLHTAGRMNARMEVEWNAFNAVAGLSHSGEARCPACDDVGRLEGEDVTSYEITGERVSYDDYDVWARLTVSADYFACENCHLILDRYELVEASGLPTEFEDIGDPADYYEREYGND
ncbi:hypothetical protein E9549_05450 [Blastococcus sp. MG754426]|uniref:hypothetical protein n=1 Tax=unclassified Blastococcus TaxID=2619396 RepID=UPI001EF03E2C|nr:MULTISPECIES: hypothetical protein [unclassified Blastococcus]MCF6506852.1 hypothetical protein [Blastococcus sp. MG754426]MCF6511652.1 hypothetical protein [Blastococcus sp. MG754427]